MIRILSCSICTATLLALAIARMNGAELDVMSEGGRIVASHTAIFVQPPKRVPTPAMPDGPLLGNGDVGIVLAGAPEEQTFFIGKNDFWRRTPADASIMAVGAVSLSIPALKGATYRQEQDMARGEVRGTFVKDGQTLRARTWVDANENLLATALQCEGSVPVAISIRQAIGPQTAAAAQIPDNDRRLNIGREQHGACRWYFDGVIDDVRIYDRALSQDFLRGFASGPTPVFTPSFGPALRWPANVPKDTHVIAGEPADGMVGKSIRFDGKKVYVDIPIARMNKGVTVAAWIKAESASTEANYIVSKGDWNQAYSLGLSNGCLRFAVGTVFVQTEKPLELRKWVHVAGTFDGGKMRVTVDGVLKGGAGDGVASSGETDERLALSWFTRKADNLPGKSREVAVATRLIGGEARADKTGVLQVTMKPGETVVVVSAILSDLDAADFVEAAKKRAATLTAQEIAALSTKHQAWWSDFWRRSFIEIPDKEIEKRWYAALYIIASCSRPGKVAPGLWGNWVTTDRPSWHGDFHLNYNFQAPYYIVYSSNHADLSTPFYQAIWESVPNGREMAKRHGWKGVHFPVGIGPWGLHSGNPDGDWGQRSDAAFAALNFLWQYQYTQDVDFLRKTAYPYLLEVAAFWEDYLKFENGRYVIYDDSIHEGSGKDMNPLLSLGLVRTLFKSLLQMSKDLNVDAERRAKWQDILDKLSAFPLQERDGKTVFRYSEKGTAWWRDNTLGIHHIFPVGAIGLDSDAKLLEICHNTIAAMNRWHDNNGFSSWYTACARVGYDPRQILSNLRIECDKRSYPSLILYYGGGGIENAAGFLAVNEMLMQSHEGVIRFFPCWPREMDARFGGLRAVGAFLVSAELKNGAAGGVKIVSEKGKDCAVVNPWPVKKIALIRNGKEAETMSGARFAFKTAANEIIELKSQ
ncbi:MAG: hypothetical protein NTX50_21670 [Candidatus Sumerlaeota bacterium]|nr:hypothetical protein [Candidatus Sumerlaeota bacterium]